jgi:hypothetical protein
MGGARNRPVRAARRNSFHRRAPQRPQWQNYARLLREIVTNNTVAGDVTTLEDMNVIHQARCSTRRGLNHGRQSRPVLLCYGVSTGHKRPVPSIRRGSGYARPELVIPGASVLCLPSQAKGLCVRSDPPTAVQANFRIFRMKTRRDLRTAGSKNAGLMTRPATRIPQQPYKVVPRPGPGVTSGWKLTTPFTSPSVAVC